MCRCGLKLTRRAWPGGAGDSKPSTSTRNQTEFSKMRPLLIGSAIALLGFLVLPEPSIAALKGG